MTTVAPDVALGRVTSELRALVARAEALAEATAAEAWAAPPPSGGWSASACLEHLSATAEEASRLLVRAGGVSGRTLRHPAPRWWVRVLARTLEPPARLKTRTSASFEPRDVPSREVVLERFRTSHRHLVGDLASVRPEDLHRVTIDSPFGPIRYTPLEWGMVLAAHGRRHLWQAERALGAIATRD